VHVNDFVKIAVERGASELHLKSGSVPMIRLGRTLASIVEAVVSRVARAGSTPGITRFRK